jgi:class 3 adenylate cyclase
LLPLNIPFRLPVKAQLHAAPGADPPVAALRALYFVACGSAPVSSGTVGARRPARDPMSTRYENIDLVFAILSVAGATAACAAHGDVATVETLTSYYSLIADKVHRARGRVIKVIGDGVIVGFPVSSARAAVEDLRSLQEHGTNLWRLFDQRCRVQVRVGVGSLVSGLFGPPGEEREDLYGDALNQLFKVPVGDFIVSSALRRVLGGD